jgi:hypothetical protein
MVMAKRLPGALVFGSALAFAACGGEGLTLPPEGEAAHIAVVWGDEQSDLVGSVLGDSLVVYVTDVRDRPVPGATVNFTFPDADAAAAPATATTDAAGIAWAKVTLGTEVGPVAGLAEVPVALGVTPVRVTFTALALAAGANRITLVSGNEQSAPAGADLPAPLVVQVTDEFGNPIPNVTIGWTFTGGGSVSAASTLTGADGLTSVTRTLGPTAGQQTAVATAEGLAGSPVSFAHTATAGSASRVNIVSGNGQRAAPGAELENPLIVEVLDAANNPVVNVAVEWVVAQGGGTATPASNRTDGQGRASTRWTLGPTPGNNTLNAVVSGVGRAEFTAVAEKIGSSVTITSDTPDPSLVGGAVQVAVTVTGDGGTPTGTVTVAGESAAAPCTITLAGGSGSCEIVFNQPGNREITATYNGDARFNGDTDTEDHQVNPQGPAGTTTTITSDAPDPSAAGAAITVSFTVTSSAGTPNGNVQVTDPLGGSCNASVSTGSCQYTPGGTGLRTITATYEGGSGFSGSTDTEEHTVNPPASLAPVAVDDSYATPSPAGSELTVGVNEGVLANDTDADTPHDFLVVNLPLVQTTPGGTLEMDVSGSFQYTPNAGTTTDTFRYQARDPEGNLSNIATVTITITP